jgi:hypothetical protein
MSKSSSAVVFNGLIYCFQQGSGENGQLWYNVFDGNNWSGDTQVPNTGMSESPVRSCLTVCFIAFIRARGKAASSGTMSLMAGN